MDLKNYILLKQYFFTVNFQDLNIEKNDFLLNKSDKSYMIFVSV